MSEKIFSSKSGAFVCDEKGCVQRFEPAQDNVLEENCYRHLIIPQGVTGFCNSFGCRITVKEQFVLPDSLQEIGSLSVDGQVFGIGAKQNVFASSTLPTVILPESVRVFGPFAFGASRIDMLCIHKAFHGIQNVRQFKDAHVRRLYLPQEAYHPENTPYFGVPWDCWFREVYTYQDRPSTHLPLESIRTPAQRLSAND